MTELSQEPERKRHLDFWRGWFVAGSGTIILALMLAAAIPLYIFASGKQA
ncbi:MAG: hypothetical protein VB957_03740 [Pseudomonadales bacterium]